MNDRDGSNVKLETKLNLPHVENEIELVTDVTNTDATYQKDETEEHIAELIITNEENVLALFNVNKELDLQIDESEKRSVELVNAYRELKDIDLKLAIQKVEKEKRAAELIIANKELAFQNEEKEKRAAELIIANKELAFQNKEKEKRAVELIIANKELAFQITEHNHAEEVLKESEERFRTLFENSTIGIYRTTPDGQILLANPTLLKLLGYSSFEELASRNLTEEGFEPLYDRTLFIDVLKREGKVTGLESAWTRMDGTTLFISESARAINNKEGKIIYYDGIVEDITLRKKVEQELILSYKELTFQNKEKEKRAAELTKSHLQLRNFASHLQNIREEEKVAIAREIHDDLGQILVALKIDLGLFKHQISKGSDTISHEEILDKFDDLSDLVDKTIKTTRRIMTGLRPEIIDSLGFIEAAKSYLLEFEERHHLPCHFNCTISELNIIPQQSVALFRILQEALNNVVKHAKATAVKIHMSIHINKLILEINDNGIGFDENHKGRQDSYGMIGMKERVTLLEGELTIIGKPGKGTCVKVEMPYLLK